MNFGIAGRLSYNLRIIILRRERIGQYIDFISRYHERPRMDKRFIHAADEVHVVRRLPWWLSPFHQTVMEVLVHVLPRFDSYPEFIVCNL